MSVDNPTPEEVELALSLISADTIQEQIKPTKEQFLELTYKILTTGLGRKGIRGNLGGSTYEYKIADIGFLMGLLPIAKAANLKQDFYKLSNDTFSNEAGWKSFFTNLFELLEREKNNPQNSQEEINFWQECLNKFSEIKRFYSIEK